MVTGSELDPKETDPVNDWIRFVPDVWVSFFYN
jgi:hypothetical protein